MRSSKFLCTTVCSALTGLIGCSALADDTEVFFGSSSVSTGAPNILLVLDTSGSMQELVTTSSAYDPVAAASGTYTGNCSTSNVYFRKASDNTMPTCAAGGTVSNGSPNRGYVAETAFHCSTATDVGGAFDTAGYKQDAGIRWLTLVETRTGGASGTTTTYGWNAELNPNDPATSYSWSWATWSWITRTYTYSKSDVACENTNYGTSYPNAVSPNASSQWTSTSGNSYWNQSNPTRTQYIFYSAEYLNWYHNHRTMTTQTRLKIVQDAAKSLLDSISGVNVGLMRYDTYGNGGMVTNAITSIDTGKAAMKAEIDSWFAAGNTPLSETYAEAFRYYTGRAVEHGDNSYECGATDTALNGCGASESPTLSKSVAASRYPGTSDSDADYKSPMTVSCQKNYIVYLTDGLPTSDTDDNSFIEGLDTASTDCYSSGSAMWTALGHSEPSGTSGGRCLKALASYMYDNDLSTGATGLSDTQNVTSYFIGFGSSVASGAPFDYLDDAAQAGGGSAYGATDLDTLSEKLTEIFTAIKDDSATFTSPSVAVNAFNKTQILEDLYISVFQPSSKTHWPGNLKKYKLRDGLIVGQNAASIGSAVDSASGFFKPTAHSYWSSSVDGRNTTLGGAANEIPAPASRNVYTYLGSNPTVGSWVDLSSAVGYSVEDGNTAITDVLLGVSAAADPALERTTLLNWMRGQDVDDTDGDGSTTDSRNSMGDPIHAQPAVVIYGVNGADSIARLNDAVVFISTNDGYLHAFDVASGEELWAFVPQGMLNKMSTLRSDPARTTKQYLLDGNIRVLKYDVDGDGVVESADGDRVFLYFSEGRGGPNYYALDVTDKDSPEFMWSIGSGTLGGVAQSWSTPTLGRVRISGATQNPQRLVLIFSGGYDPVEETSTGYNATHTFGKGVFMVDAVRGTVLWSQTQTSNGSAFDAMTHAMPSNVTVLDTDADGWTDRMYVGDLGGQIWRFDVSNNSTAANLVTGGVIASLGAKAEATPTLASNRGFFNAPDVSRMVPRGESSFYNIAIGSGDRSFPKTNVTTEDRFYSVRDYNLTAMTQAQYNVLPPITDAALTTIDGNNAVAILAGSPGWKLPLNSPSWQGEKVLADSVTIDGKVLFTTYLPGATTASACTVSTGGARAYTLGILSGQKYFDTLYQPFNTTGLPTQISIVNAGQIIRTEAPTGTGNTGGSGSSSGQSICMSGVVILGKCVDFGSRVKTFWEESGLN